MVHGSSFSGVLLIHNHNLDYSKFFYMKQGISLHNFLKKQYQTTHFSVEKKNKMTWKKARALKGEKPWICSLKNYMKTSPVV